MLYQVLLEKITQFIVKLHFYEKENMLVVD